MVVNQKVLQRQLSNHGITTYVANHGGEALDQIKKSTYWKGHGPDAVDIGVVLMDKEMPLVFRMTTTWAMY
jgi:CheY-like chemotaxis protein